MNISNLEKTCAFIEKHSCYEVFKDFGSPILAFMIALITIIWGLYQLKKQHNNTIDAQNKQFDKSVKIDLFKELVAMLRNNSSAIGSIGSRCNTSYIMKQQISAGDYLVIYQQLSQNLLEIILKIETIEITHPKLFKIFRFTIQSASHDLDQVFKRLAKEPDYLTITWEITNNAQMYISDFIVCLQNLTFSDIFANQVEYRVPLVKSFMPITLDNDKLDELQEHIMNNTDWGQWILNNEKLAKDIHKV
jgi:hypothetical protein